MRTLLKKPDNQEYIWHQALTGFIESNNHRLIVSPCYAIIVRYLVLLR